MKASQYIRRLSVVCISFALVLSLVACGSVEPEKVGYLQDLDVTKLYHDELSLLDEWQTVASAGTLTLELNGETMAIRLTDTATGASWSSNPDNADEDPLADEAGVDLLKSQFRLTYHDMSTNISHMTSYRDALMLDQVTAYQLEDGVAVHYILGDMGRDENDVPSKIRDSRFHEALLNKLSDEEAEELTGFYKFYESDDDTPDFWILRATSLEYIDRVLELFDAAGYTRDDLRRDNDDFDEETPEVKLGFQVTLEYHLDADGLVVKVPMENLRFPENYPIYQLRILENMVGAPSDSQGYIFVPDGSGALIRYDQNVQDANTVVLPVYDNNVSIRSAQSNVLKENAYLPVYGATNGNSALMAIIEENAANATIEAYRANRSNSYNAVYSYFNICSVDYVYIAGTETKSSVPIFNLDALKGNCSIRFRVLSGDKANYIGMAKSYQNDLLDKQMLPTDNHELNVPFVVETIGGVYGYKNLLGLSYVGLKEATTFDQSRQILQALKDNGIDRLQLKLGGWFNDGYYHDFAGKLSVDSALGGKKGLKELNDYCREQSIGLYPDVELQYAYRGGNGFNPTFDAAKHMDKNEVQLKDISAVDDKVFRAGRVREGYKYLLSPLQYNKTVSSFLKKYSKLNIHSLSLRSAGTLLYADYNKNCMCERPQALALLTEQLEAIRESAGNLMLNGANDYALKYAALINGVPTDYSYFDLEDEAVPFYQLVTHGYVAQTGGPINKADNSRQLALRCAEYGVGLQAQVIWQSSSFLKSTERDDLYRSNYADIMADSVDGYKLVSAVLDAVADAHMTDHAKLTSDVFKTVYDNGVTVYVNYSDSAQTVEGQQIPAQGVFIVGA